MGNTPLIYAVVLGWNHAMDTAECVGSALEMDYPNFRVVVVDNGSTDGAPDILRRMFPDIELLLSKENLGIARGYNLGLHYAIQAGADHVLLLNNDTKLDRALLSSLVSSAAAHPEAGLFMPKVLYYGSDTKIWSTGARKRGFPPGIVLTGLDCEDGPSFNQTRKIAFAPSCAILIRSSVMRKIGLFDPGYFMYYDDWDFCERVRQGGFKLIYVPEGKVWHKVSLSTQNDGKPSQWWFVLGRSTVRFYSRHRRPILLNLPLHASWIILREIVKRNLNGARAYIAGLKEGFLVRRQERFPHDDGIAETLPTA